MSEEKRFCPNCKLIFFDVRNSPILSYSGLSLGTLSNGLPFIFPLHSLSNHIAILGQTGTGKTRLAMKLVAEAERDGIQLLIIDVEGEWKRIINQCKNKIEYYAVDENFRINPFDLKDSGLIRELMRETVFKGIEKEYVDLSAQMNYVLNDVIEESVSMPELIQKVKDYNKEKLTNLERTKTAR